MDGAIADGLGEPSALSVVPKTKRPLTEHEPVGRENAETWRRAVKGDKLLVGEPGAGKTSFLRDLALEEEHKALFVGDFEESAIASAI